LQNAGNPEAWEMVMEEEVHENTFLRVWPVAIRAIKSTPH